ncbi:xanthine dehydrogenase family protein molybdopterin-binding subunit [Chloroflexota bacterium]
MRYIGDAVAAVAAVDEDTAEDAIELIDVEYEELPAVFEPEEAMKDGAPQVHDKTTSPNMHDENHNISRYFKQEVGDMEKGWAEADHIREDRFVTAPNAHAPMEPHSALATWDKGNLTVWADSQIPFFLRYNLAKVMEIPEGKVRVIKPFVGGGFGNKTQMFAKDCNAALLSKLTGRPVRIAYTREEVFLATISTYGKVIYIRTGMKKDGTITAQYMKVIHNNGAYNSTAPMIIRSQPLGRVYRTPFCYEAMMVYTNRTPSGPRRGHTSPEKYFAVETQVNMTAADLGLDPIEVRLKNFVYPGYVDPSGRVLTSANLKAMLEGVVEKSGWKEKRGKMGPYRGIGIASTAFGGGSTGTTTNLTETVVGSPTKISTGVTVDPTGVSVGGHVTHNPIMAIIKVNADGRITLFTGEADIGQGSNSTMAQITAEVIGVPQDDVMVYAADTALTPFDHGSFGSRVTANVGHVVKEAAADTKRQLVKAISESVEVGEEEIEIRDGQVYVKGRAEPAMSFARALRMIQLADKLPITGSFRYYPPEYFAGLPVGGAPAFYIHASEVEVDPETGKVRVLRVTHANDSGTEINPMRVEGQMDGSIQMGLGWALGEDYAIDKDNGQMLDASFLHFFFPTAVDMPEVQPVPMEVPDPRGPFGAKEAGEGAVCPTAPSIIDAIHDAAGIWLKELPATPENVLKALEEKRLRENKEG